VERTPLSRTTPEEAAKRIQERVAEQGFANVRVKVSPERVLVEFENRGFLFEEKAMGRVLRTAAANSPPEVSQVVAVAELLGQPISYAKVNQRTLIDYLGGKLRPQDFDDRVTFGFPDRELLDGGADSGNRRGRTFSVGGKIGTDTYLNDPSGFFRYRVTADAWGSQQLWPGGRFSAYARAPLVGNIKTANTDIRNPIRSDIADYLKEDWRFETLMLDDVRRLTPRLFLRTAGGWLETQFGGLSGELLYLVGDGRLGLSLEGDWAVKRTVEDPLGFKGFDTYDWLSGATYYFPSVGLTTRVRGGRFLAGDWGGRFDIIREFNTGAQMGFWYTYTDTSGLTGFNRDYQDKGVWIALPARMFFMWDSPTSYYYSLRPWSRDTGALVERGTLYDMVRTLLPAHFESHSDELPK
jgi:hypothetical protein